LIYVENDFEVANMSQMLLKWALMTIVMM